MEHRSPKVAAPASAVNYTAKSGVHCSSPNTSSSSIKILKVTGPSKTQLVEHCQIKEHAFSGQSSVQLCQSIQKSASQNNFPSKRHTQNCKHNAKNINHTYDKEASNFSSPLMVTAMEKNHKSSCNPTIHSNSSLEDPNQSPKSVSQVLPNKIVNEKSIHKYNNLQNIGLSSEQKLLITPQSNRVKGLYGTCNSSSDDDEPVVGIRQNRVKSVSKSILLSSASSSDSEMDISNRGDYSAAGSAMSVATAPSHHKINGAERSHIKQGPDISARVDANSMVSSQKQSGSKNSGAKVLGTRNKRHQVRKSLQYEDADADNMCIQNQNRVSVSERGAGGNQGPSGVGVSGGAALADSLRNQVIDLTQDECGLDSPQSTRSMSSMTGKSLAGCSSDRTPSPPISQRYNTPNPSTFNRSTPNPSTPYHRPRNIWDVPSSSEDYSPIRTPQHPQYPRTAFQATPKSPQTPNTPNTPKTPPKSPKTPKTPADKCDITSKAFKQRRERLCQTLFIEYNKTVFNHALPPDLPVTWSSSLHTTAGVTRLSRHHVRMDAPQSAGPRSDPNPKQPSSDNHNHPTSDAQGRYVHGGMVHRAKVELSSKVVDTYPKLQSTLLHELCHVAQWMLNGNKSPPHGAVFKSWANKGMVVYPELNISTCHSYVIHYPHQWVCERCGQQLGRHKKTIDTHKQVCGKCKGKLVYKGRFAEDGTPCKPRALTPYAKFVKQRFAVTKAELGKQSSHREVMSKLAEQWRAQKQIDTQESNKENQRQDLNAG